MVSILLASGFEETEVVTVFDIFKRGDIEDVSLISVTGNKKLHSVRNLTIHAHGEIEDVDSKEQSAIILPGGEAGVNRLKSSIFVKTLVREVYDNGGCIGAICEAPLVLEEVGLLEGYDYTCLQGIEKELETGNYIDKKVVVDRQLVTAHSPSTTALFAFAILEKLRGKEVRKRVQSEWKGKCEEVIVNEE